MGPTDEDSPLPRTQQGDGAQGAIGACEAIYPPSFVKRALVGTLSQQLVQAETRFGLSQMLVHALYVNPVSPVLELLVRPAWVERAYAAAAEVCAHEQDTCMHDGWARLLAAEHAVIDAGAAWDALLAMPAAAFTTASPGGYGLSRTAALYWVATRPAVDPSSGQMTPPVPWPPDRTLRAPEPADTGEAVSNSIGSTALPALAPPSPPPPPAPPSSPPPSPPSPPPMPLPPRSPPPSPLPPAPSPSPPSPPSPPTPAARISAAEALNWGSAGLVAIGIVLGACWVASRRTHARLEALARRPDFAEPLLADRRPVKIPG
jgi:hypothetical protein